MWCACVHQLSQDGNSILCNHSEFAHCIRKDTKSFISNQKPDWEMQRAAERWRWEDTSHSPKDRRGEESSWAGLWLRFSQRTLMKLKKKYLESLETLTPSLLPLPQQKPDAFCFECLVATSPYLITLSLQLLTCLYLPQAATSHLPFPKLPFPPPSPIPPTASSCADEVCRLYWLFFKRFTIAFSAIFFSSLFSSS